MNICSRAQVTLPDPQLVSGALIDVAKHLEYLAIRVCEKMRGVVIFTPVTADPYLFLSDDLVRWSQEEEEEEEEELMFLWNMGLVAEPGLGS